MLLTDKHKYFMNEALKEARKAMDKDEVPIGAIITYQDQIIARAHNQVEQLCDVTAHAEMIAITSASNHLNSKFLNECSLYVTIEPCLMCATAIFWSRISGIYFGATDNKYGFTLYNNELFKNKVKVKGGFLEDECSAIINQFFRSKRDLHDLR